MNFIAKDLNIDKVSLPSHTMSPKILDREIGPNGFGLMGMTWRAQPPPEEQSFAAMRAALRHGANFWNGGEIYGTPECNSLTLLHSYFEKYPEDADKVILCIKGGKGENKLVDGSPENMRRSVENSARMLGPRKKIDLFECARKDPDVEIEVTIKALAELVKEGKIGGISLSEVNANTIRRAAAVHPIAAVEVEVSLWEDNAFKNGVAATCAELGIPIVAYSPLGRGILTGQIRKREDFPEGDARLHFPRFSEENFPKNLELADTLGAFAKQKGCSPAQLALAWVRSRGDKKGMPVFVPIPGATTEARVDENMEMVGLSAEEDAEIDKILTSFVPVGDRYPAYAQGYNDG